MDNRISCDYGWRMNLFTFGGRHFIFGIQFFSLEILFIKFLIVISGHTKLNREIIFSHAKNRIYTQSHKIL